MWSCIVGGGGVLESWPILWRGLAAWLRNFDGFAKKILAAACRKGLIGYIATTMG